ncbi:hypothetical protein [Anaerosacchariphilus polymeriproducens]|uniref:Zinc ribbon domain-containing protein n=1 Tax=Anaerosacchariphilus polymeriproducens TaxID=1812858 RepID=A0A371AQU6_9FIRM|nr:hypothetical protein [Anaerosacchariphilus polymeriproducens]RDU21951.1 hypothetical protein DWV06_15550 [Anaerosacchariphilus polymeriproducens]
MEKETKYCKHCGEIIDIDCIICPKCGKQVEELKTDDKNIVINNTASSNASAVTNDKVRRLPWYLRTFWIIVLGILTCGTYFIIGIILRIMWRSNN